MKIGHIIPFAPNLCGLYEQARDQIRADFEGGNDVFVFDVGIIQCGEQKPAQIGAIDDRAGFRIETANPVLIQDCDVLVMHTGCHDSWLVNNQVPLIWTIHGRPLACFRPENQQSGQGYSLYMTLGNWKRTKKVLYFWEEFRPHWEIGIPIEKHVVLDMPVDEKRFSPSGNVINLTERGNYNFLICDSNREDICIYETLVACIEASKKMPNVGLKFHIFGFDLPISNSFNLLINKLKELGTLGNCNGRIQNMETLYRDVDCVISPNRITTRTISEATSCGIPVIAQDGNKVASFLADMARPESLIQAIEDYITSGLKKINDPRFNLVNYYTKMNEIYKEVIK